ncbi:hypothetical protein CDAR_425911 [Caerostris darwini]|uniref:Uncharacterized protein n=1 Tax=Caerostris darwini TaxID=1538125 RepID=A0AAV4SZX8_9ARAC|nr:hypothetical protein CDAR_425911 [Caerostris darwini]
MSSAVTTYDFDSSVINWITDHDNSNFFYGWSVDPAACSPDGVLSALMTIFAPIYVIWKQELNLRIMRKNNFESRDSPARSDCRGSGGLRRGNKTIFPKEQHMPGGS